MCVWLYYAWRCSYSKSILFSFFFFLILLEGYLDSLTAWFILNRGKTRLYRVLFFLFFFLVAPRHRFSYSFVDARVEEDRSRVKSFFPYCIRPRECSQRLVSAAVYVSSFVCGGVSHLKW